WRKRPRLTETRDRAHDEPRVTLDQRLRRKTEVAELAGSKVLQQNVGPADQSVQRALGPLVVRVHGDRALPARLHDESLAELELRMSRVLPFGAQDGGRVGTFDANHVGAEQSEVIS